MLSIVTDGSEGVAPFEIMNVESVRDDTTVTSNTYLPCTDCDWVKIYHLLRISTEPQIHISIYLAAVWMM